MYVRWCKSPEGISEKTSTTMGTVLALEVEFSYRRRSRGQSTRICNLNLEPLASIIHSERNVFFVWVCCSFFP